MVLVYLESPSRPLDKQDVYVLDNNKKGVKKGSERTDLKGIFLLDANNKVTLIRDNGLDRSVNDALKERKFKRLSDLKKRIAQDRKKYEQIIGGHDFMPRVM